MNDVDGKPNNQRRTLPPVQFGDKPAADKPVNNGCSLVAVATATADETYARCLAEQWQLTLIKRHSAKDCKQNPPADFSLIIDRERDQHEILLLPHCFESGPIGIDFTEGRARHRQKFGGGKKQPLARAIGLNHKKRPGNLAQPSGNQTDNLLRVCDATGGFGKDAWVLATLGCQMTVLERCNWLYSMLDLALQAAGKHQELYNIARRFCSQHIDALRWMAESQTDVDVIYLDPMYPPSEKSANVKKDMQALHRLVGPDTDSSELLALAMRKAAWRVVVKRPIRASPIKHEYLEPVSNIASVNTRYDIYLAEDT